MKMHGGKIVVLKLLYLIQLLNNDPIIWVIVFCMVSILCKKISLGTISTEAYFIHSFCLPFCLYCFSYRSFSFSLYLLAFLLFYCLRLFSLSLSFYLYRFPFCPYSCLYLRLSFCRLSFYLLHHLFSLL